MPAAMSNGGNAMHKAPSCPIITIEEHYWDKELASHYSGVEGSRDPKMLERLYDVGALRIKDMDAHGIDMQVLSHGAPSMQKIGPEIAAALATRVNDRLAAAVAANPNRLAAFCCLPTADPKAP
jgi:predicted TIM-barrel fold metal-dependent hydrolase